VSHEGGLALGPLIMHGLAKLEIEASKYVITDKGRDYLAMLEEAGLIELAEHLDAKSQAYGKGVA